MKRFHYQAIIFTTLLAASIQPPSLHADNVTTPARPPLNCSMADVDLSTVQNASLTHWKTFYTTDSNVLRAQFYFDKADAHAMDVAIEAWISSNQYTVALIKRFGEPAYTTGGLPTPPERKLFESILWKQVGNRAIPIDPPKAIGERSMIKVDGRWLMPLSELYFTDDRRMKELEFSIKLNHQMTLNVDKAKDLQAATQPVDIPDQPIQPDVSMSEGLFPVPPVNLPDTNDTFPEGALAAWSMAVFKGDAESAKNLAITNTPEQSDFLKTLLVLIKNSGAMNKAADAKFDHASEKFQYALITKSQSSFILQNIYFSAKTALSPDRKTATVTVHSPDDGSINSGPSGISIDYTLAKVQDVWRVTNPENLVSIPGQQIRVKRDLKSERELFAGIATDEQNLTADIESGKFKSLNDLVTQANSRLAAQLESFAKHR